MKKKPQRKVPFDVNQALKRMERATRPYPKAAMFELADRGHASVFAQVVGCLLSTRTLDEVTLPAAERLLERAPTSARMAKLSVQQIDELIAPCTFHRAKAVQIRTIAEWASRFPDGDIPCDEKLLRSLKGVGPKCANLVLGVACGMKRISVDVHVHRITNRWGYVRTSSPTETQIVLEGKLPEKHWVRINRLSVPFGKHVCTRLFPKCSSCPVLEMCRQVGVTRPRQVA